MRYKLSDSEQNELNELLTIVDNLLHYIPSENDPDYFVFMDTPDPGVWALSRMNNLENKRRFGSATRVKI